MVEGSSVLNFVSLWVPSQKGLIVEAPQRHRAMVFLIRGISSPVPVTSSKSPRTNSGPLGQATMLAEGALLGSMSDSSFGKVAGGVARIKGVA